MTAFDHVVLLFSFVFGLALAHVLSRLGSLTLARKRVQFSPLQALMALNAILTVFLNWLLLIDMRSVKDWDILTIAIWFAVALSNFFICAAAAPDPAEDKAINLEAFYRDQYRLFYGIVFFFGGTVRPRQLRLRQGRSETDASDPTGHHPFLCAASARNRCAEALGSVDRRLKPSCAQYLVDPHV